MRCLVVGSGAREHALAATLALSADVVVAPGNDGMAAAGLAVTDASPLDVEADLVVVGPEAPLVAGLADELRARGRAVVGPGAAGARLEGSKAFLKEFVAACGVPTAAYRAFGAHEVVAAGEYLRSMRPPYVVKTDGLAAGKGVLVTSDLDEALADVEAKLSGRAFGAAGSTVVVEEGLAGVECSLMVLVDGRDAHALVAAQDYKRVGDADAGANTGGMGAFAPAPLAGGLADEVMGAIVAPTLRGLAARGIDYRGVLYAGLMLTSAGPTLLEYNVRFGDPEAQVVAPLYGAGLAGLLDATARGGLAGAVAGPAGAAVTVVLASRGYPEAPAGGDEISGLGPDGQLSTPRADVAVYHAGTRRDGGRWVTTGGRALSVTALAGDVESARAAAYDAVATVTFDEMVVRSDVARAVGR